MPYSNSLVTNYALLALMKPLSSPTNLLRIFFLLSNHNIICFMLWWPARWLLPKSLLLASFALRLVLSCSIIQISHRHLHVAQTKCILLRPSSTDLLVQQNSGNNVTSLVFSVSCADIHCFILVFTVVFSYISIQLSIVRPFPLNSQACLWLKPLLFLTSFYSKSSLTSKRNYTPPLVNCHFNASSIPPLFAWKRQECFLLSFSCLPSPSKLWDELIISYIALNCLLIIEFYCLMSLAFVLPIVELGHAISTV